MWIFIRNHININVRYLQGAKYLISSAIAFSLMTVCVKHLKGRIPVAELVFTRAIISLAITRFILFRNQINPWGNDKKLLLIRGLLGTGALFCIFKALAILPLASATIIQYTYPIFTSLAASIFLKEKINAQILLAILLGFIGITLIVQPGWLGATEVSLEFYHVLIAICGAVLTALAYTSVRKLSQTEHPLVIVHYFPLISVPITLPFVLSKGVMPINIEWIWLIGIGMFTQIGQVAITKGLKLLPAARASSINYTQVLLACFFGIVIFKEPINNYLLVGSLFILASTLISISAKPKIP